MPSTAIVEERDAENRTEAGLATRRTRRWNKTLEEHSRKDKEQTIANNLPKGGVYSNQIYAIYP